MLMLENMAYSQTLRSRALDRLAALSANVTRTSSSSAASNPDFIKLCEACPAPQNASKSLSSHGVATSSGAGRIPMSLRELEVLLALCQTASAIDSVFNANRLLQQLSPYLSEACYQAFAPSPFLRRLGRSPWERLTSALVDAALNIGLRHPSVREKVVSSLNSYIYSCSRYASVLLTLQSTDETLDANDVPSQELFNLVKLATSILGFFEAASSHTHFWQVHEQRELLRSLESLLSEKFLVMAEAAFSTIRNAKTQSPEMKEWKHFFRQYAVARRPLGAMLIRQGFMKLVASCALLFVVPASKSSSIDPLKALMESPKLKHSPDNMNAEFLVEKITDIAAREIVSLEEGSDYLRLESSWQQRTAYSVKASSLISFLCCSLINDDIADSEVLMSWLEASLSDSTQVADDVLASSVLKCMAVMAKTSSSSATSLSRKIPSLLVREPMSTEIASVAADCLLFVLKLLPQDTVITTLYSLGNSLSTRGGLETTSDYTLFNDEKLDLPKGADMSGKLPNESVENLASSSSDDENAVSNAVIRAIVTIAKGYQDEKITALAIPMLVQKVGKSNTTVKFQIITKAASLAVNAGAAELRSLLRLFTRITEQASENRNDVMLQAVAEAQADLSKSLKGGSALYDVYLQHLLEMIIAKGDVSLNNHGRQPDFDSAARAMALYLGPLALLVASNVATEGIENAESYPRLQRDAWYNIVVHGFSSRSPIGLQYLNELRILAQYSQPLIGEDRADQLESDIELNTILRRGMNSENTQLQRREMIELLPRCESDIRSLNYPELMFLKTAHLIETLRASRGDSTKALSYFVEPKLRTGPLGNCMTAVATEALETYLSKTLTGKQEYFSAPFAAEQLALIFQACCHRVESVQTVAYICANRVITQVPSALCHRKSIFSLLDILTIMWTSCLEAEMDEYEWNSEYSSQQGSVKLQLSDDYTFRRQTLAKFHASAQKWMRRAIDIAPLDVKGLLQTYLSEYSEDEAFGHMSLGRSFAFDSGAMIPRTDQRLGAVEADTELDINTASDFMAQYTSRQEYRFTDPSSLRDRPDNALKGSDMNGHSELSRMQITDVGDHGLAAALALTEQRLLKRDNVPIEELRNTLRRAASLLCRSSIDESAAVSHFVKIPFISFSKQTIKIGLSLWMGVIKENPRMEPKILTEVIEGWITTVRDRRGIFNARINHVDPFYIKEEFAPSDKELIIKQQRRAVDNIAPHFRVLQFLSSHYTATRLNSSSVEMAYHRFLAVTLLALRHSACHPLTREVHFHIVLLGFRVMKHSTSLNETARWRLKDDLLSAGLAWFSHAPRWSFGGNRLQVKAELQILADTCHVIQETKAVGSHSKGNLESLCPKQELLTLLLISEQNRLNVWLFPLQSQKKHLLSYHDRDHGKDRGTTVEENLGSYLQTAWDENPAIAIHLASRVRTQSITDDVRDRILNNPEKVIDEPDALAILLGSSLTNEVSFQLKYLAYWAPVDPMTAVIYFLPAFGNHPSIIQYAVRALESHSVDITFFYVPQIVQTLRYDLLGYVERYIVETGRFSQLFAHQIIWNMNANAYKDEDSQIPDPLKPTLDRVRNRLISSFSDEDRGFYEREFSFFNEITGISGKLRPFIKKSKPEKKQKIEEELRKIQVEVGVYLPSNPDGVVVGIDRKSGKPLQSHAKAPYMATFRIRKEVQDDLEYVEEQLEEVNHIPSSNENKEMMVVDNGSGRNHNNEDDDSTEISALGTSKGEWGKANRTYDVWQSAIFKVGDDCRQDVLALQMIAAFRGIFHHVGLPVYVYPYRVTATAPGCGVIDVLPNSISRDMLGREAVNGLYDWFISKFGGEDAPAFQMARANFVKSLAAYSVISYLLQFKDRHNGNIMLDDQGHILHIDFGFCFDIAPGGVRFERAPFKLTKEMVAVMGGSQTTQSFRWFEELCVKAFLAARPYVDTLANIVVAMLDSGLPCFKPETTTHFRDRFVTDKSERDAADFMRFLVRKSYGSYSTKGYDQFQLMTNGIPY